jgi:hypothetical protein
LLLGRSTGLARQRTEQVGGPFGAVARELDARRGRQQITCRLVVRQLLQPATSRESSLPSAGCFCTSLSMSAINCARSAPAAAEAAQAFTTTPATARSTTASGT